MSNVEYKVLKSNIIRCCESESGIHFKVDYDKLSSMVQDSGLILAKTGLESRYIKIEDIPFLNEYFIKDKLNWFDKYREITVLTFFANEDLDDEGRDLLDKIATPKQEVPDEDKIHDMAVLVSKYPCYFATVVSYKNLDPRRIAKPSYFIICRANKVAIRDANYKYNPDDMA
jgi:hypothetical protein